MRHLVRHSILLIVSMALAVPLGAACKQPPAVEETSEPGNHNAKERGRMTTLLDQVATLSVESYHPRSVVNAVNALLPLGKEEALEQIESYLKSHAKGADTQGLFWVLRVLFDVPAAQGFPPVRIGQPSIPPPADAAKLPRFPILIAQDIPLLVVNGYDLGGLPEPVEAHVAFFRDHGSLRSKPLAPPTSTSGVEQELLRQWSAAYGATHTDELLRTTRLQLTRMGE